MTLIKACIICLSLLFDRHTTGASELMNRWQFHDDMARGQWPDCLEIYLWGIWCLLMKDSLSFVHMLLRRMWKCPRWYDCRQLGSIDVLCMSSTGVRNNYWVIKVLSMMRGLMINTLESEKKMTAIPWCDDMARGQWRDCPEIYLWWIWCLLMREACHLSTCYWGPCESVRGHMIVGNWAPLMFCVCHQLGWEIIIGSLKQYYWYSWLMRGHVTHIKFKAWNGMATILLMTLSQSLHFDQWQTLHFY